MMYLRHILIFVVFSFLIQSCDDEKVERCEDENNEESCAEFRITESQDETTYALGDFITVRTDKGTFSSSDIVDLRFYDTASLPLCGGELFSKAIQFKATDSEGEVFERTKLKNRPMYVRIDLQSVVENRDESVFAIVLRSPPSSSALFLGSDKYAPTGSSAVDKLDVNFYTDDPFAVFYLVRNDSSLDSSCNDYQTVVEEEEAEENSIY